ncbi:LPS export ABC transporter periplasmic protein LptC [Marinimicrobium alkaliphilum]|uniref:LPS export ABC transporter periplasmic protein LptC n=1 Tax=Marinimicrobium alkaliphilum TaxID=2202654 RepID=UPI000DBA8498|nr:LPS export ABC transporter periplasmic protein LptC [Marinimicrobium alkaliphilum]
MNRRLIFGGLGALVVFLVVAFWDSDPRELLAPPPEADERFPNAYLRGAQSWEYDAEGALGYQLAAPEVEHFQQSPGRTSPRDYILFHNPEMTFHSADGDAPWQVRADTGRSEEEGERVTLEGQVRGWKRPVDGGLLELTTERLELRPEQQFAQTDKAVTIRTPQGVTRSIGMRAYLDQDRIELLANVRGDYEP